MRLVTVARVGLLVLSWSMGSAASAADITATVVGTLSAPEKKNAQTVLHWWHEVYEAHHVELAPKYMTPEYIQHNPNIPSGRDAFIQIMSRMPVHPIRDELYFPPKMVIVKDDHVVLVFERDFDHPREPGKTYTQSWIEVIRVQDGLIAEHWDSAYLRDAGTYSPPMIPPYERWQKQQQSKAR